MKKYSDFPIEIQRRIAQCQIEQGNAANMDILANKKKHAGGFDWGDTPENYHFWYNVIHRKETQHFFDRYPKPEPITSINVGDEFMCVEDVYFTNDLEEQYGNPIYLKGKVYKSEYKGCINDEEGDFKHWWIKGKPNELEELNRHFIRHTPEIKESVKDVKEDDFATKIDRQLCAIKEMLVAKNKQYGNSALEPLRIFSKASPTEQLLVRIDDKLSRIANATNDSEDAVLDLMGYLVLLRINQTT